MSTLAPPFDLADVVEEFWEVEGFAEYKCEKHLPRGTIEVIFNLGQPYDVLWPDGQSLKQTHKEAWISGHHEGPLWVAPTNHIGWNTEHLIGIRLYAASAYVLFGQPAHMFSNKVVELSNMLGKNVSLLCEQLYLASSPAERFMLLIAFLRDCRERVELEQSACVAWTYNVLRKTCGRARIMDLCANFGVSRKHLNKLYQEEIGISPKRLARIIKFASTIDHLSHQ